MKLSVQRRSTLLLCALALLAVGFLSTTPARAASEKDSQERLDNSIEVLTEIINIPEGGIPPSLLGNCKALIVIPNMVKAGFIVAANRGKGIMVHRLPKGGWSDPAFCTITGGSVGFQIGGQATDLVMVVNSEKGFQSLLSDSFKFGAGASVAAGPVGRETSASTDAKLRADIFTYSRSKGVFAGVSLEGAGLTSDDDANTAFYKKTNSRKAILSATSKPYPAPKLLQILKKYPAK